MRRLIQLCLVIMLAMPLLQNHRPASAEPYSDTLYTCIFPDGPYAGHEILVRYDAPNAELSLVSNNTGETVQILENGLNTPQFDVRGWSSDCRYMIASIGVWGEQSTAAWDVVENRRVGTIATKGLAGWTWAPTNDYRLLIESLSGAWLWYLPSNSQALLTPYSGKWGNNFALHGYDEIRSWDLTRNQLLVVTLDPTRDGVMAYDINNGQEVAFYAIAPTDILVQFRLFDEGRHMLVFANYSPIGNMNQLVMFDRATGSALPLAGEVLASVNPMAVFSASGRYLIIRTWEIYVWDLQKLDTNTAHLPNYTLYLLYGSSTGRRVRGLQMNADETIVQAAIYWDWYRTDYTIWQWDLATGERFYAKKFSGNVCDDLSQLDPEDDVEMVTWACGYR